MSATSLAAMLALRRGGRGRHDRGHRLMCFGAAAAVGLACTACATIPPVTVASCLVAVRYDVEPVVVHQGRSAAITTIRRDLEHAAKLGFNSVVFHHVDDSDRREMLDLAGEMGLIGGLFGRGVKHYVALGALPEGCSDAGALARTASPVGDTPARPTVLVADEGTSVNGARRCAALCAEVRGGGARCLTMGAGTARPGADALAVIDIGVEPADPEASPVELWLAQYHRGLFAGRTAGVVLNRYRRPPGDPPGLVPHGGVASPARLAALRELLTRVRLWGPRIHRHRARPVAGIVAEQLDVRTAALAREGHRCLLVFNPSSETYARGEVLLPETIDGREPARAVEVPPSQAEPAGRVFKPRGGRIALPIALRPGDAALFELF